MVRRRLGGGRNGVIVTQLCPTLCEPIDFPRQEYWSGLPFPTPGDLPDPGIEPAYLASAALAGGFFTTVPPAAGYTTMYKTDN